LRGEETEVFGDAGYEGADKRPNAKKAVTWHVAMLLGKRKALDKDNNRADASTDQLEKTKAGRGQGQAPASSGQAPV
jgi:IS5 family transposase